MGVHIDAFSGAERSDNPMPEFGDGYLVFFGRLAEKKGVTYLLRAMGQILERYSNLGLAVVGYGPLEAELKKEANELGISDAVRFLGRKTHAEIGQFLRCCRVAVVPSIIDQYGETEGMPTVVIEAMAGGVRVVGSAVDGIPDVIRHRENGWLCREKDPEDLAEKILTALDDEGSPCVPIEARKTADIFAWSKVARRYHAAFENVLSK
jgi:glycosyltransferase involved in cell wall biosynthesis